MKMFETWVLGHLGLLLSDLSELLLIPIGCYPLPFLRRFLWIFEIRFSIWPSTSSCIDVLGNKSPLKLIETFRPLSLITSDGWVESSHSLLGPACDRVPFTPTHTKTPLCCVAASAICSSALSLWAQ